MKYVDTFEKHRSEPNKTVLQYQKELDLELGQKMAAIKKIYLDTKFWIYLRDAELKVYEAFNEDVKFEEISTLLNLLKKLRKSNSIICPISVPIFCEILKNKKEDKLITIIKLIDELSGGICIKNFNHRAFVEFICFFCSRSQLRDACYPAKNIVWTKLSLALGGSPPDKTAFPKELELIIQKAFLDQRWEANFSDIYNTMGFEKIILFGEMENNTNELNFGKIKYAGEYSTFEELLNIELEGIIVSYRSEISKALRTLNKKLGGGTLTDSYIEKSEEEKKFENLLYCATKDNKARDELPSLYIPAALHASIRWDKSRKYKSNDSLDLLHAASALPYFEFFFTENSLKELVSKKSLGLTDLYNCCVLSKPVDIIEVLIKN